MVFLEARQTIEAAGAGGELDGGTLLPVPEAATQAAASQRRGPGADGRRGKKR